MGKTEQRPYSIKIIIQVVTHGDYFFLRLLYKKRISHNMSSL